MISYSIGLKTLEGYLYNIPVFQIAVEVTFYKSFSHRYYYLKRNDEGNTYFHNQRYDLFCIIHNNEKEYISDIRKFNANNEYEFYFFVTVETAKKLIDLKDISYFDFEF